MQTYPDMYNPNYPECTGLQFLDENNKNLSVSTLVKASELSNIKLKFEPMSWDNIDNSMITEFTAGKGFDYKSVTIDSSGKINISFEPYTVIVPQYGTAMSDEALQWPAGTKVIEGTFTVKYTYKGVEFTDSNMISTTQESF